MVKRGNLKINDYYFFPHHSVTTSCEYVWLGTDLARAKPTCRQYNQGLIVIKW